MLDDYAYAGFVSDLRPWVCIVFMLGLGYEATNFFGAVRNFAINSFSCSPSTQVRGCEFGCDLNARTLTLIASERCVHGVHELLIG
ncbi:hypothetical protein [Streptomyces paromomycinus]|uniref:hypothetical protein n=1 Tax=Streptomyces paromomycinus TaxID=92743 RepID=UPI001FE56795|nr:hypothetical protein [Streptomyces paromomycinus]